MKLLGVYRLFERIDGVQVTRYVGETNSLAVRKLQHLRDPRLGFLDFEQVFAAPNKNVRRGLEQRLYLNTWSDGVTNIPVSQAIDAATGLPSLNRQRLMSSANPMYDPRSSLVDRYLNEC